MAKVRQQGTEAEILIRRALYRIGVRYRIGYVVLRQPRRVSDLALISLKIAVFVDGCFWHGCPQHASWPKKNAKYWKEKIKANQTRDRDTSARLEAIGWKAIRVWEHESPAMAARSIARVIGIVKAKRLKAKQSLNKRN